MVGSRPPSPADARRFLGDVGGKGPLRRGQAVAALVVGVAVTAFVAIPASCQQGSGGPTSTAYAAAPNTLDLGLVPSASPSLSGSQSASGSVSLSLSASLSPSSSSPSGSASPSSAGPSASPSEALELVELADSTAASIPGMHLGVAVIDLETGQAVSGSAGEESFISASVVKLLVSVDILERQRAGEITLTSRDRELMKRALSASDDEAMNELWSVHDGYGAVSRIAAELGLSSTSPPADYSQWGDTQISALDMVKLEAHMMTEMPSSDRVFLTWAMSSTPAEAADGFLQGFGLMTSFGLTPGTAGTSGSPPIVKQGWVMYQGGTAFLHSIGVVGPGSRYAVAMLTRQSVGGSWDQARTQLTVVSDSLRQLLSTAR